MNWDDRDNWDFKTVAKCAAYYDTRDMFEWKLPSEHEVFSYVKERTEKEINRLRELRIADGVEFDSEYQAVLLELRPIASKLFLVDVNSRIFSEE